MPGQIRKMLLTLFPIRLAAPPDGSQPLDAHQHRPLPTPITGAGPLQPGLYPGSVSPLLILSSKVALRACLPALN